MQLLHIIWMSGNLKGEMRLVCRYWDGSWGGFSQPPCVVVKSSGPPRKSSVAIQRKAVVNHLKNPHRVVISQLPLDGKKEVYSGRYMHNLTCYFDLKQLT